MQMQKKGEKNSSQFSDCKFFIFFILSIESRLHNKRKKYWKGEIDILHRLFKHIIKAAVVLPGLQSGALFNLQAGYAACNSASTALFLKLFWILIVSIISEL